MEQSNQTARVNSSTSQIKNPAFYGGVFFWSSQTANYRYSSETYRPYCSFDPILSGLALRATAQV